MLGLPEPRVGLWKIKLCDASLLSERADGLDQTCNIGAETILQARKQQRIQARRQVGACTSASEHQS